MRYTSHTLGLWGIHITFDLPKQAATPMFGIHVVLTAEPKPVTVCSTEPSCNKQKETHGLQFCSESRQAVPSLPHKADGLNN